MPIELDAARIETAACPRMWALACALNARDGEFLIHWLRLKHPELTVTQFKEKAKRQDPVWAEFVADVDDVIVSRIPHGDYKAMRGLTG